MILFSCRLNCIPPPTLSASADTPLLSLLHFLLSVVLVHVRWGGGGGGIPSREVINPIKRTAKNKLLIPFILP